MLLKDILSVILIPSIVSPENNHTQQSTNFDSLEAFDNNWKTPDIFRRPEEGGLTPTTPQPQPGVDPLLDAVNEDVRRLGFDEYSDDYFDHLEDKSEEVRELIRRRKQALDIQSTTTTAPTESATDPDPTTEFPIMIPSESPEIESTTTTKKPSGIITGIKNEAGSIFGKISNAGRSLFGRKTTTTTAAPPPPEPEQLEILEVPTKNCTIVFQIFFQGDCRNLLQNQFCPTRTQWLIEDPVTLRPKCVENPCHEHPSKASFGGSGTSSSCIGVGSEAQCHKGMRTFIYRSGIVECDCKPGYLFNQEDGACYEAYKRGPCSTGQHFKLSKAKEGKPICMSNPCVHEDYFCNAPRCVKQRNCERIGSPCGSNGTAKYELHPLTFTPICNEGDLQFPGKIIGNVPTLSCAPGSRRDILGNCRTPTTIDFS